MRKLFNSDFKITQYFANDPDYYKQFNLNGHEGIDLIPTGTDWSVLAAEDGIVVKDDDIAGEAKTDAYGRFVTLWHPSIKKATMYCHLEYNSVSNGQQVKKGEVIGKMGATGNTRGAHLHFNLFDVDENGVRLNKVNGFLGGINPLPFLQEGDITGDTILIPKKDFENMFNKSTQWDKVCGYLGIDPNDKTGGEKAILKINDDLNKLRGQIDTKEREKQEALSAKDVEFGATLAEKDKEIQRLQKKLNELQPSSAPVSTPSPKPTGDVIQGLIDIFLSIFGKKK